jgi:hypothetical protein
VTCSKIFLHIVNTRWVCSLIYIWIRRQFPLLFVYKQERSNHMFSMNEFQLMTDRSRYFNPSKNYWFSFNAFLISLIGLYFRCLSFRVALVNTARPDGAFLLGLRPPGLPTRLLPWTRWGPQAVPDPSSTHAPLTTNPRSAPDNLHHMRS